MEMFVTLKEMVSDIVQHASDAAWLGLAKHLATKKSLGFFYAKPNFCHLAEGDGLVCIRFKHADAVRIAMPTRKPGTTDEEFDTCLRAEMRRLRRAAQALGIEITEVVIGQNGQVMQERA